MFKVTVILTFQLLTPKLLGVIYGSWLFMIQRKLNLDEISLKLMIGTTLLTPYRRTDRQTDGRTDRQTDGQTDGRTTYAIT